MAVGPDYKNPKLDIAKRWLYTSKNKHASVKEAQARTGNWWKVFSDPTLNKLIQIGYRNNLTLQTAGVHVLLTRAQLAQTVGQLYPQEQGISGNYTYNRIGGSSLQSFLPSSFSTASLGFGANWEIDFWGKYRRAIESKDALFLSSVAAYDYALVTLVADIASTYIDIRTSQSLIGVTNKNIRLQRQSLDIASSRYRNGETSLLDVQQAKTQLGQTQSQLPGQVASLQVQKNQLAVLLGTTPDKVDACLKKSRGIPSVPRQIEVNIPKEVMAQRPDVMQSRLNAIANSAAIGEVKANLFPALSLFGNFSFTATNIGSSSISDIFQWSNRAISAGPSLSWPILNYGQITNAVRTQDAAFQEALLQYQQTVLQAQKEVQDGISQYTESKKTIAALYKANRSAISSSKLSLVRYKEGESTYTTVLNSEQQQLQVQTSLTNARGDAAKSVVALFRALGGGWQLRKGNDIVPMSIKKQMAERTNWGSLLSPPNHLPPTKKSQVLKQTILPNW